MMEKQRLGRGLRGLMAGLMIASSFSFTVPQTAQADGSANQNSWQYNELYRNQYHYSAKQNWLNDPNGLLYDDSTGIYHMYYQYNPNGNGWGDMSWGHATSRDLINWNEQPVAIEMLTNQKEMDFTFQNTIGGLMGNNGGNVRYWGTPSTNNGLDGGNKKKYIFSGSTVLDKNNVTGLGANTILAYYTSCFQIPTRQNDTGEDGKGTWIGMSEVQEQHLAYSTDGGYTFIQYDAAKNAAQNLANSDGTDRNSPQAIIPVTAISGKAGVDARDFRDPKVVYDEVNQQWLMVVVVGQQAMIFKSTNLIDWTYASAIQRGHDVGKGVWECPELIPMTADDGQTKWILTMSVQDGAYASGSGMQYFVGDINSAGEWTPATTGTLANPNWLDYGEDFYAGVTFGNTGDRRIMLAWESNWLWTGLQKTTPWYSNMTIPRELKLVKDDTYEGGYKVTQAPVAELDESNGQEAIVPTVELNTESKEIGATGVSLSGDNNSESSPVKVTNYNGTTYKIEAEFEWESSTSPEVVGMLLRGNEDFSRKLVVGYHLTAANSPKAFLNILSTGDAQLSGNGRDTTNVAIANTGKIKLTALVDESSIEIFVNDGEKTITQVFYFRPEIIGAGVKTDNIAFFVNGTGKSATVKNAKITPYRSIFGDIESKEDIKISNASQVNLAQLAAINSTDGTGEDLGYMLNVLKGLTNSNIGSHEVTYGVTNAKGKYQVVNVPIKIVADKSALKAAIDQATALDESAYTTVSWATLTAKLEAANTSYNSTDDAQAQTAVDTAQTDLATAISSLVSRADKKALNAKIDEAEGLTENDYSKASWSALSAKLGAAKTENNTVDATQAAVNQATNDLASAISGLVNRVALAEKITEAQGLTSTAYTTASWSNLTTVLNQAKAIYDSDAEQTQDAVNTATSDLTTAISSLAFLANKTALNSLLDTVVGGEQTYTADSWLAYSNAKNAATTISNKLEATQTEVDEAYNALFAAIRNLKQPLEVNKTALQVLLQLHLGLKADDYTTDSWAAVATKQVAAAGIYTDNNATQSAVDTAVSELKAAIDALVVKPVVKTALEAKIAVAEGLTETNYTSGSWASLSGKLTAAKGVQANTSATQAEVNTAESELNLAISSLVQKADKTALSAKITEAERLTENDYTKASWSTLTAKFNAGKAVNNTADATQAAVNQATNDLASAISGLVNRVALAQKITEAQALASSETAYTTESWSNLTAKLNEATTIYNSSDPQTQDVVNTAITNLNNAILNLAFRADKTALNSLLTSTSGIVESTYTTDSWVAYFGAKASAEMVSQKLDATQAEVDNAYDALFAAIRNLTLVTAGGNKAALVAILELYNSLVANADKYTTASWQAVLSAQQAAQIVNDNPAAMQEAIDTAKNDLSSAIANLQVRPSIPNPTPTPVEPPTVADDDSGIEVSGENLPDDTTLVVEKVTNNQDEAYGQDYAYVDKKITADFELFDISLFKNNEKVQPKGQLQVSIPIPAKFKDQTDKLKLYYYNDQDHSFTQINGKVESNAYLFNTDHFSYYLLTTGEVAQPTLKLAGHIQNIGDQSGTESFIGTTGKGLRLEAVKLSLNNEIKGISYQVHVQNEAWLPWQADGREAGTRGKGQRVEAIIIQLSDELKAEYDIFYRVHIQNRGTTGWYKNGETAGTTGKSLRLEALQVVLVKKSDRELPAEFK